jgi:hypothetical protein
VSADDTRAALELAQQARTLGENRALATLLEQIEQECIDRWRTADTLELREACWQQQRAVATLRTAITRAIDTGTFLRRHR